MSVLGEKEGNQLLQKGKVSYDDTNFLVEFDVRGYDANELSIKTEGDILVVGAQHHTTTESGHRYVSKEFERRFTLPPGVNPDSVVSSLSKDGVLTVTAPRQVGGQVGGGALTAASKKDGAVEDSGLPHPRVRYDEDKVQISLDVQRFRPDELDVRVEEGVIIVTAKQETKEPGGTRSRVYEQKFTLPTGVNADEVTSTLTKDGVLIVTAPREGGGSGTTTTNQVNRTVSTPIRSSTQSSSNLFKTSNIEDRLNKALSPSSWDQNGGAVTRAADRSTTLSPVSSASGDDDISQPGASTVKYEDGSYKILINVKNFKAEELVIKTIDNTVILEAKHEEKTSDGHSFSSRQFDQKFGLPRGVNPDDVTSSLSKEGILTISAPLPQFKGSTGERLIPIKF